MLLLDTRILISGTEKLGWEGAPKVWYFEVSLPAMLQAAAEYLPPSPFNPLCFSLLFPIELHPVTLLFDELSKCIRVLTVFFVLLEFFNFLKSNSGTECTLLKFPLGLVL